MEVTGSGFAYASAVNLAILYADKEAEAALWEEGLSVTTRTRTFALMAQVLSLCVCFLS